MKTFACWLIVASALPFSAHSYGAPAYSEDFEVDHTANWNVNKGPSGNPADNTADFFFDYSTAGIPLAPHSQPNGFRGLNLQANQDAGETGSHNDPLTGLSVSPKGQDFSSLVNYRVTCDAWANAIGPFPNPLGTPELATFGIGTSGTVANFPSHIDGLMFAASADPTATVADFRAYAPERPNSGYVVPPSVMGPSDLDAHGNPIDGHATFYAGSRNSSAALYMATFPSVQAPAAQTALYPQQTGSLTAGSFGMQWHQVEITKFGKLVTWTVDHVPLATVDMTDFVLPLGGGNVFFGQSDQNGSPSTSPLRTKLLFTVIDNIRVEAVPEPPTNLLVFTGIIACGAFCGVARRHHRPAHSFGTKN